MMRLSSTQIQMVIRLRAEHYDAETIAGMVHSSRTTIYRVLDQITEVMGEEISWPMSEERLKQVENVLKQSTETPTSARAVPDWDDIHREMARPKVTLLLLHSEYVEDCILKGVEYYSYSQFARLYKAHCKKKKLVMRIMHKPGDVIEYDWAGATMQYCDPETGQEVKMYLYVAVLPYSLYFFVDAYPDMTLPNWIDATCSAFEKLGVARIMRPDNLKTAVTRHTREEVSIQRNFRELSLHYHSAVVPTGNYAPTHKSSAESTVKKTEQKIIAACRNMKFFSAEELREKVRERADEIIHTVSKALGVSPYECYMNEEKEYMKELPRGRYEMYAWSSSTIGPDYLIKIGKNKYSVPYTYVGERVDARTKGGKVEVFDGNKMIATHDYVEEKKRNPFILKEHMPKAHQAFAEYTVEDFRKFGESVGPETLKAVNYYLTRGEVPDQGFQFCASLKALAERHGAEKLEEACTAVQCNDGKPELKYIDEYLKNKKPAANILLAHSTQGNTRGASQFNMNAGSGNNHTARPEYGQEVHPPETDGTDKIEHEMR